MLNILVVLLFILTLPIWLILLAMISPILVPVALGVVLWVMGRKLKELGKNLNKYESMVAEVKQNIEKDGAALETELEPEPKPQGTPDKLLQRNGYTIEMYLREKPAVYRILDPNMVDFGISYGTLAEALREIESYSI